VTWVQIENQKAMVGFHCFRQSMYAFPQITYVKICRKVASGYYIGLEGREEIGFLPKRSGQTMQNVGESCWVELKKPPARFKYAEFSLQPMVNHEAWLSWRRRAYAQEHPNFGPFGPFWKGVWAYYAQELDDSNIIYCAANQSLMQSLPIHLQKKSQINPYPSLEDSPFAGEFDALFDVQMPLPSGGFVTFETTQACVAIDVNASSASIKTSNWEAISVIARQIELRNLSGILVVDFIYTPHAEEKKALGEALHQELRKNPKVQIGFFGVTRLGLCEYTRSATGPSLQDIYGTYGIFSQKNLLTQLIFFLNEQLNLRFCDAVLKIDRVLALLIPQEGRFAWQAFCDCLGYVPKIEALN
jgi:hypothetical protein